MTKKTSAFGKKVWEMELAADYEFTQQRFKELNPYRPAEFTRDWNVNTGVNDVGHQYPSDG